jgi:MoxR-like ATPase
MNAALETTGPGGMPLGSYLDHIGVHGYSHVEAVVLAAVVSGDPLLLIGRAGTGKTYLLNSLSEVLQLEHRHYNASMIAFDDLVGFPLPDADGTAVRYVPTPATVWGAESVLVDEINRCRPEHQNRFFSLVHERKIQGIALERLRYRWAAMNPVDEDASDPYRGCEPLDPALADRFAYVVTVKDWVGLTAREQRAVADPRGEGAVARDGGMLAAFVAERRPLFEAFLADPPDHVLRYFTAVASACGQSGIRISPRRVRQLVRNQCALAAVGAGWGKEALFLALRWGIPQRATEVPEESVLRAAHRVAWGACGEDAREEWLHRVAAAPMPEQVRMLFRAPDPDAGTLAVNAILAAVSPARQAVFAVAVLPRLMEFGYPPVGADGLADLAALARKFMHFDGTYSWYVKGATREELEGAEPPELQEVRRLPGLTERRRKRFFGFVSGLLVHRVGVKVDELAALEEELYACWRVAAAAKPRKKRR